MQQENRSKNYVWIVMMVLSLFLVAWTLLVLAFSRETTLQDALNLAGSPLVVGDLDPAARGFLNMAMLKPLWEETWFGILGIYCAVGLAGKKKHAWTLGLFWGITLIAWAGIQGGYEIMILKWSFACLQSYFFLFLGTIAVISLLITRKGFFPPIRRGIKMNTPSVSRTMEGESE
jgi:hypothetical protein